MWRIINIIVTQSLSIVHTLDSWSNLQLLSVLLGDTSELLFVTSDGLLVASAAAYWQSVD